MAAKIFITGKPGCGKSTLIKGVLANGLKGKKVAGIITPGMRDENGVRSGFKIIDIASGKEEVMASVDFQGAKVSKYGVSVENINKILEEFRKSLPGAELIVLDEIGKMEFKSGEFKKVLGEVLASEKPLLAALHRALVKDFGDKGEVIWLSEENKQEVRGRIIKAVS